jgi:hypothetical protein
MKAMEFGVGKRLPNVKNQNLEAAMDCLKNGKNRATSINHSIDGIGKIDDAAKANDNGKLLKW